MKVVLYISVFWFLLGCSKRESTLIYMPTCSAEHIESVTKFVAACVGDEGEEVTFCTNSAKKLVCPAMPHIHHIQRNWASYDSTLYIKPCTQASTPEEKQLCALEK